jgi:hypothetical protein
VLEVDNIFTETETRWATMDPSGGSAGSRRRNVLTLGEGNADLLFLDSDID